MNVDVFTDRAALSGGRVRVGVRFVVDGVTRTRRVATLPDDFATLWALLDADEKAELAEELAQRFIRAKVENLGDIKIVSGR